MIKTRKTVFILLLLTFTAIFLLTGCEDYEQYPDYAYYNLGLDYSGYIVLATSLEDTDLLNSLLSSFTDETGFRVLVMPVPNSAAFELGRNGDVDVIFANAPALEWQFVYGGYAQSLYDVMINDVVLVGPRDGGIEHNNNISDSFFQILFSNKPFISRGDGSTLHLKELQLWSGFYFNQFNNPFYVESFASMRATLSRAAEENAFTLTDTATWLAFADRGDLIVVCEDDFRLMNRFTVMAVSSSDMLEEAEAFVTWITGSSAQEIIRNHGLAEYGVSLFTPSN
ncbi:MAG: substrate-binding domain-containing protein [Oscillospiraceae bacterium]|nr:substrate-binding domain-containing protein [Oscillospiraceae bacterium]MCL2279623.1 substrate-binding domain-containing protein [Oscillospiraceae bacterium]